MGTGMILAPWIFLMMGPLMHFIRLLHVKSNVHGITFYRLTPSSTSTHLFFMAVSEDGQAGNQRRGDGINEKPSS